MKRALEFVAFTQDSHTTASNFLEFRHKERCQATYLDGLVRAGRLYNISFVISKFIVPYLALLFDLVDCIT